MTPVEGWDVPRGYYDPDPPKDEERDTMAMESDFSALMNQVEADLASAHAEICKLQGLNPQTHTWPEWSSPAHTLLWIAEMRKKYGLSKEATPLSVRSPSPEGDDIAF
jgi:hypothetical protein